jgi:hypothetical protein
MILKDKSSVHRILQSVPKHVSIEHRANPFVDADTNTCTSQSTTESLGIGRYSTGSTPEEEKKVVEALLSWCHNDIPDSTFDSSYNGLAVLPRALTAEALTPVSWSAVLRAIILRLEPVKQMRKNITMRSSDIGSKVKPLTKSVSASSVASAGKNNNSKSKSKNSYSIYEGIHDMYYMMFITY